MYHTISNSSYVYTLICCRIAFVEKIQLSPLPAIYTLIGLSILHNINFHKNLGYTLIGSRLRYKFLPRCVFSRLFLGKRPLSDLHPYRRFFLFHDFFGKKPLPHKIVKKKPRLFSFQFVCFVTSNLETQHTRL